jgi:hypothetical protein
MASVLVHIRKVKLSETQVKKISYQVINKKLVTLIAEQADIAKFRRNAVERQIFF